MALNGKWRTNFIKNIKNNIDDFDPCVVCLYVDNEQLNDMLQFIPRDVVNMIYDYMKDVYTFEGDMWSRYVPTYVKRITIRLDKVSNNTKVYDLDISISYNFYFDPQQYYEYSINRKPLYSDVIVIKNRKEGSNELQSSFHQSVEYKDIACGSDLKPSEELINVIVFVVNELVKILINANNTIIDDEYLKKID